MKKAAEYIWFYRNRICLVLPKQKRFCFLPIVLYEAKRKVCSEQKNQKIAAKFGINNAKGFLRERSLHL